MLQNNIIGFIGGGNMAEAIIKGLVAGGVPPRNIVAADPVLDRRAHLATTLQVRTSDDNTEVANEADLIVLAIKPRTGRQCSLHPRGRSHSAETGCFDHGRHFHDLY